ncbi:MAG: toll/interleukin-1 receptor domain-containing protein [Pseudomonadota bacterium]
MADVFISYSMKDRDRATELAQLLEQRGLDVFYDQKITASDRFEVTLERELRAANRVVVLWSRHSIESRFVVAEAHVALDSGKLFPVIIDQGLSNSDLPPPFNALQNAVWLGGSPNEIAEEIVGAGHGGAPRDSTLPEQREGQTSFSQRQLRLQTVYWLGVGTAILTIANNLGGVVKLADIAKVLFTHWGEILSWLWSWLAIFQVEVAPADAVLLTTIAIIGANLFLTSQSTLRNFSVSRRFTALSSFGALATIGVLSFLGFREKHIDGSQGFLSTLVDSVAGIGCLRTDVGDLSLGCAGPLYGLPYLFGLVIVALAYWPSSFVFSIRPNYAAFSDRLWFIIAGVGILGLLNLLLLNLESQPWWPAVRDTL